MKKSIFKALAATAVVGTVIALSGVAASAATTLNAKNAIGLTPHPFDNTNTGLEIASDALEVLSQDGYGLTVEKVGKAAIITYGTAESTSRNYFIDPTQEGTLAGTTFDALVITTAGQKGVDVLKITGTKANDKVEIYYTGVNSNGQVGKALQFKATNVDDTGVQSVESGSTNVPHYKSYTVAADGDVVINVGDATASSGERIGIAAIVITPAGEEPSVSESTSETTSVTDPQPEETTGSIEIATASANDKTYVIVGVDDPKAYENIQLYASNNTSDNTADSVTTNGKAVGELITTVYKAVTGIDPLPTSSQYVFAQEVVNGSGTYNFVAKSGDTTSDVVTITQGGGGGDETGYVSVPYSIDFSTEDARTQMGNADPQVTNLHDNATLNGINYQLSADYTLTGTKKFIAIKSTETKPCYIKFNVNKNINLAVTIVNQNRTLTITDGNGQTYGPITSPDGTSDTSPYTETVQLPAGEYTLTNEGSEVHVSKIEITAQ